MSHQFHILYAEDNALDADLTRAQFAEHAPDIEIEIVQSGRDCLERLSKEKSDLLLLDHRLPDMDGLDVLRMLIQSHVYIPVILVTGSGDEELVVMALQLGASNYVSKAGDYLLALPDLIREVIRAHRAKSSQGLLAIRQRRVLYVEHHEMDIDLTLSHFAEVAPQFEFDVVRSCSEALARLELSTTYDAALIDLRMSDKSGLEFVREAGRLNLALPPFIMISGKGDEATAIASLTLGAADYIAKREGYLRQLPYTIDRAIAYRKLDRANAQLQAELLERKRAESDREQLETQLRASQKLEAIGSLAGGIAHDFNNLLTVILNFVGFAIDDLTVNHDVRDDLLEVRKAATRAAVMTRQLLAFSRKQVLQPVPLDLNQIVVGLGKMLRHLLGENIEFVHVLAPDLGLTVADPGQMEQVLMNLVLNSRDAMSRGGKLTVETSNIELSEEYATQHLSVEPGPYVQMAVTDTGCGMDEPTQARIFEPFFTTKDRDRGTGLGLSTVYGIVKQSGGNIWVYSEPHLGTTFRIYLPRQLSAIPAVSMKPTLSPARAAGTETILVAEDEDGLRKVAVRALEAGGYKVLSAVDGEEALDFGGQSGTEIHLLLTDVVMPRLGGLALAQKLLELRPNIKVIFMSGYADNAIVHHGVLLAGTHLLTKPFTSSELTRRVREVLDSGATEPLEIQPNLRV